MNFAPLVELIHARTGVEVPCPAPQFELAVSQRILDLGLARVEDYVAMLRGKDYSDHEWTIAIHNSTNGLTHFMRDEEQIDAAMALLVQAHRLHGATTVRIWSAGCSTGEEPYSLAILAREAGLNAQIVATDVNPIAIEMAKRGLFAAWALRRVPDHIRLRYFEEIKPKTFRIKSEIADRVSFRQNNLVADAPPNPGPNAPWHMVICRNVLIYYKEETISSILLKVSRSLDPCGFLVLGASETLAQRRLPLMPCLAFGRIVYGSSRHAASQLSVKNVRGVRDLSNRGSRSSMPMSLRQPALGPESVRGAPPPADEPAHAELPESYLQIQDALLRCLENDQTEAVLAALKGVVASNPEDNLARLSLGHMYLREHRFADAADQYEAALKLDDSVAEAHFFVGVLLRKRRRPEAALESLRRAVFLEPTFWAATYLLAATAQRLGNLELGRSEFRRTKELLESTEGSLPLVTHPLFHTQFLEPASEILLAARDALESNYGG